MPEKPKGAVVFRNNNLEWLIDKRYAVQKCAHEVLELSKVKASDSPETAAGDVESRILTLFTGASFSLWRAIYLIHDEVAYKGNIGASIRFLERVLGDNAVTYGDDINMNVWSCGYYLGSAQYRLMDVVDKAPFIGGELTRRGLMGRLQADRNRKILPKEVCDLLLEVLEVEVEIFKENFGKDRFDERMIN